jgi:hypothetical protein
MSRNIYKIEDIEIGDEIYFDDVYARDGESLIQSNRDEYWTVHGKSGNSLLVNLYNREHWSVDVSDVRMRLPVGRRSLIKGLLK